MTKKLNSMPDYRARISKHPHDVSQSTAYTCAPGMLLPVYHDMLHGGDEIHFSASEFVRMNPLEQQALGEIDVHLDYFFVPLTVMYLPSSSLFYQTDDLVSSVFVSNNLKTDAFPTFDVAQSLTDMCTTDVYKEDSPFTVYRSQGSLVDFLPIDSFDCMGKSVFRLMDLLDMAPETITNAINGVDINYYPRTTPWFALAYQAIYQLFFRNDDREPKLYHYNIDDKYNVANWAEPMDGNHKSILQINYVSRPKDYFNAVKVSPISSSASLFSSSSLQSMYGMVNEWLFNSNILTGDASSTIIQLQSTALDTSTVTKPAMAASPQKGIINSASIRQMFMVEKLLRVVGRAEKNYESQFLAHFGIEIPHDVMHNITHLGHDMMTIRPEAVISQADTWNQASQTGAALGEIGGQGSGMLSGKKRSFKAPFHGVFMCISHVVPRRRYVLGLSKLHSLNSPQKFWQPEFDQKGMQPLFAYEAMLDNEHNSSMTKRLGWQFAYEEFKRKSDRITRAFMPVTDNVHSVNSYSPWVIGGFPYGFLTDQGSFNVDYVNNLAPWRMLVSPTEMNINMQVLYSTRWSESYNGAPWLIYQTDPFICDFNMYCKKVNGMSEYGEPEL